MHVHVICHRVGAWTLFQSVNVKRVALPFAQWSPPILRSKRPRHELTMYQKVAKIVPWSQIVARWWRLTSEAFRQDPFIMLNEAPNISMYFNVLKAQPQHLQFIKVYI